jgi:glycosyltransferase involved in cell wall biosynthesis
MCAILEGQLRRHPTLSAEIILVFDGCARYEWVRDHQLYRTIELPYQLGIASARNTGLGHAASPVVAFLDDDALPVDTWLSSLLRGLATYPRHIAFGGRSSGMTLTISMLSSVRSSITLSFLVRGMSTMTTDPTCQVRHTSTAAMLHTVGRHS